MKQQERDWDLIRRILLEVESGSKELDSKVLSDELEIEEDHIVHNMILTEDAGWITSENLSSFNSGEMALGVPRLTHAGHEFLDPTKNETVWAKVKEKLGDNFNKVTSDILKSMVVETAKKFFLGL